jgi:hypothetical protein
MNMQFKEERRAIVALNQYLEITEEYWNTCETFIQLMEIK